MTPEEWAAFVLNKGNRTHRIIAKGSEMLKKEISIPLPEVRKFMLSEPEIKPTINFTKKPTKKNK